MPDEQHVLAAALAQVEPVQQRFQPRLDRVVALAPIGAEVGVLVDRPVEVTGVLRLLFLKSQALQPPAVVLGQLGRGFE
jgi:hypothetical protein